MNMNDQNFGEFLKTKREQQKITLRQLAEKLGVSAPFLSDVEKGRRNSLDMDRPQRASGAALEYGQHFHQA